MKKSERPFSRNIKRIISEAGVNQAIIAARTGIDRGQISRWVNGLQYPSPDNIATLARTLGVSVTDLVVFNFRRELTTEHFGHNPKPLRLGDCVVDDIYLICGSQTEEMEMQVSYDPTKLHIPKYMTSIYNSIIDDAKKRALQNGYKFFNGTTVRLKRITETKSYQSEFGIEKTVISLTLAPLMWFDYVVLNEYLDDSAFLSAEGKTIRQLYANAEELYRNGSNIEWCQLSNIMPIYVIPITSDGFAMLQVRNPHGVSSTGGRLTAGVTENIQRYRDESRADDLSLRLHPLDAPAEQPIKSSYNPKRVPSPLLAAERGIYEEISKGLLGRVSTEQIKFLNIVWDMEFFAPALCGILDLDLRKDELVKLMQETWASDHTESQRSTFMRLSTNDDQTMTTLTNVANWDRGGLAAAISALKYYESHERAI